MISGKRTTQPWLNSILFFSGFRLGENSWRKDFRVGEKGFSEVSEKLGENASIFFALRAFPIELGAFGAQNHFRQLLLANLAKTLIFKLGESPSIVGEKKGMTTWVMPCQLAGNQHLSVRGYNTQPTKRELPG